MENKKDVEPKEEHNGSLWVVPLLLFIALLIVGVVFGIRYLNRTPEMPKESQQNTIPPSQYPEVMEEPEYEVPVDPNGKG